MSSEHSVTYLAGDIGGTNSRLQLFQVKSTAGLQSPGACDTPRASDHGEQLLHSHTYPSQHFASLTFVIQQFLKECVSETGLSAEELRPVACCLAVAGPVRANKATITNVDWKLDGAEMSKHLGIPDVLIINDFVGIGYGLLALERKDVTPINDVPASEDAPKSCIGAGTGLGEVYLTAAQMLQSSRDDEEEDNDDETKEEADSKRARAAPTKKAKAEYNVWASEGGHADFAPRDATEYGLLEYFKANERVPRVSVERIVSGLGIPKIYEYFASIYPDEVDPEVTRRLLSEDKGMVIGEHAVPVEGPNGRPACSLCLKTVELFVKCYGAETGNLALKTLPFGGLYIGGGIALKLKHFMLANNLFYEHFVKKGRMQAVLEKVPVFLIEHDNVGLLGAKVVCRRLLRRSGFKPGRGHLASYIEATPRASSNADQAAFSFPMSHDEHLQPPAPEQQQQQPQQWHQPHQTASPPSSALRRSPSTSHGRKGSVVSFADMDDSSSSASSVRAAAFRGGLLGGVLAGVVGAVALLAVSALRRNNNNSNTSLRF